MDRLAAVDVFVAVVESGSFSAAARAFGVGQVTISRLMSRLEGQVGVQLLRRTTRSVVRTDAGRAYYRDVKQVQDMLQQAELAARNFAIPRAPLLRIGSCATFARFFLVPFLAVFSACYPRVEVELNITDGQPDKGAGLDLNFVFGAPMAVDAQMVVRSSRVIVAAERYLRQASEPTSPTDLSEHPFILTKTTNTGLPLQLEKAGQRRSIPLKGWLTCDCTLSTQVAVVSGLGIAVVPAWLFHSEIASGQVKPLLADWNLPAIEVWACPSTNSPAHSSEAERFVSSLKEWALERTP